MKHIQLRPGRAAAMTMGLATLLGAATFTGCRAPEDPGDFSRERPPADRLDRRDSGLQSVDIIRAADQMAISLLSLPEVQATPERLLIVVDRVENRTSTYPRSLDIFLQQVKVELAKRGRSQIQLIENRDRLRDLQSRELEQPPGAGEREDFGGGDVRQQPGPAGIQPDYSLYAIVSDLPNRGTNFYQFQFDLTDLRTRELIWTDAYNVRVAR